MRKAHPKRSDFSQTNLSLMALKECIRARTMASAPGAALTVHVRENGLFEPFYIKNEHFTQTGSGQA